MQQKAPDSTVPFSARLSRELDFKIRQRAADEGRTLTEIHLEALRAFLVEESLAEQLARIERAILSKIFAVVAVVANLSDEQRRDAKAALKSILTAEARQ